jgi:hypothetical protein
LTGEPQYLADSHHIFYVGIGHGFRADGSFGTDWCLGAAPSVEDGEHSAVVLQPRIYEVYWCCSMRGGELFARASESTFFTKGDRIILTCYHNATVKLEGIELRETTGYPIEGKVRVEVLRVTDTRHRILSFFIPPWRTMQEPVLTLNGIAVRGEIEEGFVEIGGNFSNGDVVELEFGVGLHVEGTHNSKSVNGLHSFRHGPLLLVLNQTAPEPFESNNRGCAATIDYLPADSKFEYLGKGRYVLQSDPGVVLTPVYNVEEFTRPWHARQALFFAGPG